MYIYIYNGIAVLAEALDTLGLCEARNVPMTYVLYGC